MATKTACLCAVVFRQQKVAALRLLRCCWKQTAVFLIAKTVAVVHQATVFQRIVVIRCIHCCPDVAQTCRVNIAVIYVFFTQISATWVFCHALNCLLCLHHPTMSLKTLCFLAVRPLHSSFHSSFCPDRSCYHISHERLEQSQRNIQGIFISPTDDVILSVCILHVPWVSFGITTTECASKRYLSFIYPLKGLEMPAIMFNVSGTLEQLWPSAVLKD